MDMPDLVASPSRLRWLWLPPLALAVTWLLFLLMYQAIRAKDLPRAEPTPIIGNVRVVQPQRDKPPEQDAMKQLQSAPPPPPAAPPALAQPSMPTLALPTMSATPIEVGAIAVPIGVTIGGGPSLAGSGSFGGFASGSGGGGSGSGAGGGGSGNWKGKPLVPLSTARPQMPEWACKQKLAGWVEAVFVVDQRGRTRDIRIADADPKGVYETAAIDSIANWLYEPPGAVIEVRQRVPMDPADCVYNYR